MHKILLMLIFSSYFSLTVHSATVETLFDAWKLALISNHQIKAAKAQTRVSKQQLYATQGQRLPTLNIGGNYTQLSATPSAQTHIAGQSAQFPVSQAGSGNAQAIISLPLFSSGRISHQINAAKEAVHAARENETLSAQKIKMQVAQAYITVLRSQSALRISQSHVDSLISHRLDVTNRYHQGMVARNDLLSANVELANARQSIVQAENQLDNAWSHYNQLLNRPLDKRTSLADSFPEAPRGNLPSLTRQALAHRPELTLLDRQIESLRDQAKSVKAELLPQLSLDGGYQFQENRYQAHEGLWKVRVGMEWKLFDGSTQHRSNAVIRQAMALQQQHDDLGQQIVLQVRRSWLNIQETQRRMQVTQGAIVQAEENLKVTRNRYQQGLATQTDVMKAEELRTTTLNNNINARYDYNLAIVQLRRSLGLLTSESE